MGNESYVTDPAERNPKEPKDSLLRSLLPSVTSFLAIVLLYIYAQSSFTTREFNSARNESALRVSDAAEQPLRVPPSPQPTVWDDPESFRRLAERSEPWPLRTYPPSPLPSVLPERCKPSERTEIRFRGTKLSVWVDPWPATISGFGNVYRDLQLWKSNELRKGLACPADRMFSAQKVTFYLAESISLQLDGRCHEAGLPPDPRPECDRPEGTGWYRTFVLGLPHLLQVEAADPRTLGSMRSGLHAMALREPDLERRTTKRGNTLLLSRGGTVVHGTILPRIGPPTDTSEPLFVSCSFEWQPPMRPHRPGERAWEECFVRYDFEGTFTLSYRFLREVFDEPDVAALDLRVRNYVRTLREP